MATVFVNAASNAAPIANVVSSAIDITSPADSVYLDGSLSLDPDGTISAYSWNQEPGGPNNALISSPTSSQTWVTNLVQGVYTFQLQVTDNHGATGTKNVVVTVSKKKADSTGAQNSSSGQLIINANNKGYLIATLTTTTNGNTVFSFYDSKKNQPVKPVTVKKTANTLTWKYTYPKGYPVNTIYSLKATVGTFSQTVTFKTK